MVNKNFEIMLGLRYPIYWNDWALEQESAELLVYTIIAKRPKVIVELGSGLSTLLAAKIVDSLGLNTKIYSIDSSDVFLGETKNRIAAESLVSFSNISFIHAPIREVVIGEDTYNWYDIDKSLLKEGFIDLLFVDGPLGSLNKKARYPAVPFFIDYLKPGSTVLLDDSNRPDEQEIINDWTELIGSTNIERNDSKRGIVELIVGE